MLSEFGDVTTLSYGKKPTQSSNHMRIETHLPSLPQTPLGVLLLAVRAFRAVEFRAPAVKRGLELVGEAPFDLVVANEARALPLARRIAGPDVPVWGDMHEWAPEERVHVKSWKILIKPFITWICKKYLPAATAVTVVNDSIAQLYQSHFGVTTTTVRNARPFEDLKPSPMDPGVIRLVHSGGAVPGRNLEGMIHAAGVLGHEYSLDMYLVPARDGGRYKAELEALATSYGNVRLLSPVLPHELPLVLNAYDLGVFSLPPQTRNHALMLPNKFFDFVQARLGVVFSPSPETDRLIKEHDLGAITRDFSSESLVETIRSISRADIQRLKENAHRAATLLSSQTDENSERDILRRLLKPTAA
ncbi:hypothetical protein [Arthrobacter sp. D2-10]